MNFLTSSYTMRFRYKTFAAIVVCLSIWLMRGLLLPQPMQAQSNKFPIEIKWRGQDRVGDSLVKLLKAHIQRSQSLQLVEPQGAQLRLVLIITTIESPVFQLLAKNRLIGKHEIASQYAVIWVSSIPGEMPWYLADQIGMCPPNSKLHDLAQQLIEVTTEDILPQFRRMIRFIK
jgi:hypothetical protein